METQWDNATPIYRQMRDRLVVMILEGKILEGDPLPSVRDIAARYGINPLTVLKACHQLVIDRLIEKRRGKGLYVCVGAKAALLSEERSRFLSQEWPRICACCARLGIDIHDLPDAAGSAPVTHKSG